MNQVLEWIIYLGAFLLLAVIIGVLYVIIIDPIVQKRTGKGVSDDNQSNLISFPIYFVWIILAIGGPLVILRTFGLTPPLSQNQIVIETKENKNQILSLNEEVEKINSALSNIDNLTLNQIQNELSRTRDFVYKLKKETELQNNVVLDLKLQAEKFKMEADNASKIAIEIKELNQNQLDAVKFLLTEDANSKNQKSFWMGAIISFPIGVIASIFGNFIWGFRRKM
jgi:hypothetical protein